MSPHAKDPHYQLLKMVAFCNKICYRMKPFIWWDINCCRVDCPLCISHLLLFLYYEMDILCNSRVSTHKMGFMTFDRKTLWEIRLTNYVHPSFWKKLPRRPPCNKLQNILGSKKEDLHRKSSVVQIWEMCIHERYTPHPLTGNLSASTVNSTPTVAWSHFPEKQMLFRGS